MKNKKDHIWVFINKHYTEGAEVTGYLLDFVINDLWWQLNFQGDAPLLIFHNKTNKKIVQIDSEIFFPIDSDLAELEDEEDEFDGYLFPIEEAIKILHFLLYEDLELEIEGEMIDGENAYTLEYTGDKKEAFNKFFQKVKDKKKINPEDILSLK